MAHCSPCSLVLAAPSCMARQGRQPSGTRRTCSSEPMNMRGSSATVVVRRSAPLPRLSLSRAAHCPAPAVPRVAGRYRLIACPCPRRVGPCGHVFVIQKPPLSTLVGLDATDHTADRVPDRGATPDGPRAPPPAARTRQPRATRAACTERERPRRRPGPRPRGAR